MQTVDIFSDANFLAVGLLENLLSKNVFVNVVTKDTDSWVKKTSYIANKSHFKIVEQNKFKDEKILYSIVVAGFLRGNPYDTISEIFNIYNLEKSKILLLIPAEKNKFKEKSEVTVPDNMGAIYIGDLVGPRIDLESDLLMPQLINSVYFKKKVVLGIGEVLYPVFVSDVVKTLGKWLFSFGPYGKESLLTGPQISGSEFWKINGEIIKDLTISYDENINIRKLPKGLEVTNLPGDPKVYLEETYKWLGNLKEEPVKKSTPAPVLLPVEKPKIIINKKKAPKVKKVRRPPKYLKPLVLTVLTILIFPVFLLLISSGFFYLSYRQFLGGHDKNSENLLLMSKTFSVVSHEESRVLSLIPAVGRIYRELAYTSGVFIRFSEIGISSVPVLRSASDLTDKIFGNNIYDPTKESVVLKEGFDNIYMEISLLQADTKSGIDNHLKSAAFLDSKINLEKYKNLTLYGKNIVADLPSILGVGKVKTYLLLFQNNMELRPTGGFIGSFGILTFDGGRITDLAVNDVYSADGQLNGHVEPPAPIKKYLGEGNWWLRDSNWDPDFPTSAKRAEWFLDKELGRNVDGVMAIDLYPVKEILKYTGPVFLADFNEEITSNNLYEKTQEEVQENFFPGSRKKASFLTALSRSLLSEISKLKPGQKMGVIKTFYDDLNGRHIQMFMHNDKIQNALGNLLWDGSFATPSCGEDCYPDFIGDVEANLGVNKANYFIERGQDLSVGVGPQSIARNLTITLKNNSNPALGPSGQYKTYLRMLVPKDSEIESVSLITGSSREPLNPDISEDKNRQEIGVWIEVLSMQTKKIELKWRTVNDGSTTYRTYGLYVRKQAGVGDDPFSLTVNGKKVYNSNLAEDYFNRFNLK